MKYTILSSIGRLGLLVALAMPVSLTAQLQPARQKSTLPRFLVADLGTLPGGTFSQPLAINWYGIVAGSSNLSDGSEHAVLWFQGNMIDMGAPGLGGANSIAFAINARGHAVGEVENSTSDPNGEDFCGFGTHVICLPFQWEHDVMTPLPTLGGYNAVATGVNNFGEMAGYAENSIRDPRCPSPQVLHFEPVVWNSGRIHQLPTFRPGRSGHKHERPRTGCRRVGNLCNFQPHRALQPPAGSCLALGEGEGHGLG